jgi:hypothetical protein
MTVIIEPWMLNVSATPWKAAYDSQVKEFNSFWDKDLVTYSSYQLYQPSKFLDKICNYEIILYNFSRQS